MVIYVCLLFSSGMPILYWIAAANFWVHFWFEKYELLKVRRGEGSGRVPCGAVWCDALWWCVAQCVMWCSGLGWGCGAVCDVVQWIRLGVGRSV